MGEMSDYYYDLAIKYEDKLEHEMLNLYNKKKLTWVTKEKEKIIIQYMTTNHVKNCINMLNRKESPDYITLKILKKELYKRQNNEL